MKKSISVLSGRILVVFFFLFLLMYQVSDIDPEIAVRKEKQLFSSDEEVPAHEITDFIALADIPSYSGNPYIVINNNIPFFKEEDNTLEAFEYYSELDELGRCQVSYANICQELMPEEERGKIGYIMPSGWQSVRYDNVEGVYLYNRCHLIGYQLAGENDNEKNLITGTRYLNTEGMLPFENMVADYVMETGHHVLYRVTPMYDGDNLLATGVLMEGKSVEDNGEGIQFNVFCYNSQPGVRIDYADGSSSLIQEETETPDAAEAPDKTEASYATQPQVYVLNTSTKKYHRPECPSVPDISLKNRMDYYGDIHEKINEGYVGCKRCNP